jgi:hypothetical protein
MIDTENRFKELDTEFTDLMKKLGVDEQEEQQGGGAGSGQGEETEDSTEGGAGEDTNEEQDSNDGTTGSGGNVPDEELSEKQKKQLEKALAKQQEFVEGNTKKSKMSKKDKKMIEAIEHSDASTETVTTGGNGYGSGETEVVVIRKINEKNRGVCEMYGKYAGYYGVDDEVVRKGFQLGTMLGKKLRVRNDDIKTTYNRQRRGGIDRRLLAELGVGNNKIFEKSFTTTSNDAGIHISIDASGSMGGKRFQNAMTTAIAVIKAADMVGGIRVRVDLRSDCTSIINNKGWGGPCVMVVYDSKVNNLVHVKKNFPYLRTGGGTPEGLCFQAIKDIIKQGGKDTDKYFINMSDGAPAGRAVEPTRRAVKDFKMSGLKVLSYFISNGGHAGSSTKDLFDGMYGKESTEYIDTTSIVQIAKTLNKLLSERG